MDTSLSPSAETHTNGGAKRQNQFNGPCFLKMLVPNVVAGSIIGKNGTVIASIEHQTGCTLKLSPAGTYFPGTQERVLVMSGQQEHVNNALLRIVDKLRDVSTPEFTTDAAPLMKISCKLVLPKSAVSAVIGKGGQQIKELQAHTGCKIQISSREENLNERVVSLLGNMDSLHSAALSIAASAQTDTNMKDHMYVTYPKGGSNLNIYAPSSSGSGGYSQSMGLSNYGYQQQSYPTQQHEMLNHQCEISLCLPDHHVGPVIGRNGVCLSEIIQTSGARVQISQKGELVPGTTDRKCCISGSICAVHTAHIMLLQRLENAQSQSKHAGSNGLPQTGGSVHGASHIGGQGLMPQQNYYSHQQLSQVGTGYVQGY